MDKSKIPYHVAIIPDGNRRWARHRGLKSWEGHEEGAKRIEELSRQAIKIGITCLTFWGSSVDNLTKRPLLEKRALLDIYERYFQKLVADPMIMEDQTRIGIFGRWREQFPEKLKKILQEGIEKTVRHKKTFLNFLLAYSGEDDVLAAVRKIIEKSRTQNLLDNFSAETFSRELLTADLPAVDLVIRTGVEGDPHNSCGFLMWQTQNSQLYFSEKFFPDFTGEDLICAVKSFIHRERRMGK